MGTVAGEKRTGEGAALAQHIVERPRLIKLLDTTDAIVRVLSAPAGYGKTTVARQWLGRRGRRAAWYQVTSASTDVAALAIGISSAAAEIVEGAGSLVRERIRARRQREADADLLAEALLAELSDWPENCWLVIDDYHRLMDTESADRFIECIAQVRKIHLLLLSRRRPRWLTARQLMYGEIFELGAHALAMTPEEASNALKIARNDAVSGLVALANGWPAVIGLAALATPSLREVKNELPEALHSYFAEEVYQGLPAQLRDALLPLSITPTITTPLAKAHRIRLPVLRVL